MRKIILLLLICISQFPKACEDWVPDEKTFITAFEKIHRNIYNVYETKEPDQIFKMLSESLEGKELEKQITIAETRVDSIKANKLSEIKTEVAENINKCLKYNELLKNEYSKNVEIHNKHQNNYAELTSIRSKLILLVEKKVISQQVIDMYNNDVEIYNSKRNFNVPEKPSYIEFTEDNKVILSNMDSYSGKALLLLQKQQELKEKYMNTLSI